MNKRAALGVAIAALMFSGVTVANASLQSPTQAPVSNGTLVSSCNNPTLNADLAGWGRLSGGTGPTRTTVNDHQSAKFAFTLTGNPTTGAHLYAPQQPVAGGESYEFAFDQRTSPVGGQARVAVDWYSTPAGNNAGFLGHTDGPAVALTANWTRVAGTFTAPATAVRANVLSYLMSPVAGASWSVTACEYLRTTSTTPPTTTTAPPVTTTTEPPTDPPVTTTLPPVTTTTTTPPVGGDGVTAAGRFNWPNRIEAASDEFNYVGAPGPKWNQAGECWPANPTVVQGRCASRSTVDGTKLVMDGRADGRAPWLASKYGQQYGRWEARVRSYDVAGSNGREYHPLLIIWPDSEQWPQDGEYDFLENGSTGATCAESFIHYPHPPGPVQQEFKRETNCGASLSEWHNVAFEWTPQHVKGFIDGVEWFSYSGGAGPGGRRAIQSMPSGHLTIQLDNFTGTNMTPSKYEIDWVRTYDL